MSAIRRLPHIGRRALALAAGVALVVALVIVFSGTLTRSTDVGALAEQAQAEVATRERQLAASEAELEFFETDEFVLWQARKLGFGKPGQGEKLFALPAGAPAPEPIAPIGPQDQIVAMAPFDAWMELLFGA